MTSAPFGIFPLTEAGEKGVNEDAFAVTSHIENVGCTLATLADGQGGRPRGREAAHLACQSMTEECQSVSPEQLLDSRTWPTLLSNVDSTVSADADAGYTTLLGIAVMDHLLCGASSGDSAVLVQCGSDDPVLVTARQIKNPPVGSGGAIFIPFEMNLIEPWSVLLMSDGVWKYVGLQKIEMQLREHHGQDLLDTLLQMARLPGSGKLQDDFTAVLLQSYSMSPE